MSKPTKKPREPVARKGAAGSSSWERFGDFLDRWKPAGDRQNRIDAAFCIGNWGRDDAEEFGRVTAQLHFAAASMVWRDAIGRRSPKAAILTANLSEIAAGAQNLLDRVDQLGSHERGQIALAADIAAGVPVKKAGQWVYAVGTMTDRPGQVEIDGWRRSLARMMANSTEAAAMLQRSGGSGTIIDQSVARGKDHLVRLCAEIVLHFTPTILSGSRTGKFADLVRLMYAYATGSSAENRGEGLDSQIVRYGKAYREAAAILENHALQNPEAQLAKIRRDLDCSYGQLLTDSAIQHGLLHISAYRSPQPST